MYARLMHLLFVQLPMLTILHNLYIIPRSVELARFIPIHLEDMSMHSDSNLYQHFSIYLNHLFLAVFVSCVTPQIYYQNFLFQYLFLEKDRNFHFFPGQFIVLYWSKTSWNFYANEMMWWFLEKLKMQEVFHGI